MEILPEHLATISEEDLLNYYTTTYQGSGILPTVAAVALALNANPVAIQAIVESNSFRVKAVGSRGLPIPKKSLLSPEQFRAVAIITDPTIGGGLGSRLRMAGITYAKYNNWMLQTEFKEAVNTLAEKILSNSLADVNMGLVGAAAKGDVAAIKFYYEVTGRYNPNDQKVLDVLSVLNSVIEILQEEIRDPATLQAIATKMQFMMSKTGLPVSATIRGEIVS